MVMFSVRNKKLQKSAITNIKNYKNAKNIHEKGRRGSKIAFDHCILRHFSSPASWWRLFRSNPLFLTNYENFMFAIFSQFPLFVSYMFGVTRWDYCSNMRSLTFGTGETDSRAMATCLIAWMDFIDLMDLIDLVALTWGHRSKTQIHKNAKMFKKWVAVARRSLLTTAFCIIFRDTADGNAFSQK